MDLDRLDTLARSLAAGGSRRRLLGVLAAAPVAAGLLDLLNPEDAAAKDRRRRRKQRHKRRKQPGDRKGKGCKPRSQATVCAGTCGPVKSAQTCGKTIDCGSCDCSPACNPCFTCQGTPGTPGRCVPQDAGTPCGNATTCDSGTLSPQGHCDGQGACARLSPVSCAPYLGCDGDACATSCASDGDCVPGAFCNGSDRCAGDQANGAPCNDGGDCLSGFCAGGVCCNTACDGACETCNASGSVGTCSTLANGSGCGGGKVCCAGACQECCDNTRCAICETCDKGLCVADSSLYHTCDGPCPTGQWCDAGACASITATVSLPDCEGLCGASREVCGQTVTCPACNQCQVQTGCPWNTLFDGPQGPGTYCSFSLISTCASNADCADDAPFSYCAADVGAGSFCARMCPF